MKLRVFAAALLLAAPLGEGAASAQYRLRADAYATAGDPGAGLLVLSGDARKSSWFDAETVVWLGTGSYPADVLVTQIRMRDPEGRGEIKLGRLLVTAGGLRPLHLDGFDAVARSPWGTSLEVFGGVPVAPAYETRDYDWAVGQRLGQRIGEYANAGLSYLQMRSFGSVDYDELALDASLTPTRWLDVAFAGAYDLVNPGIADARVSAALRFSKVRVEAFAVRRSPSHLLPATSLFSALGDIPSDRAGGSLFLRLAPRLDFYGEGSVESLGGQLAGLGSAKATLRLDDRGDGALAFEARRQSTSEVTDASWTGFRASARVPIVRKLTASTELEIVRPDDPKGRGAVWPWGLLALRYRFLPAWELAGAAEASASPTAVASYTGLFRLSYVWAGR